MTIKYESIKIQAAGNSLFGNIEVEAFDEHASRHIIQSDSLLPKQINHNSKKSSKNRYNISKKCPKPLNEYIRKEKKRSK